MSYIQDIVVSIAKGFASLKEPSFRPLVLGSDTAAIAPQLISAPTDLIAFGYVSTDPEYEIASEMFSQLPAVKNMYVGRKATATAYEDALDGFVIDGLDFWGIIIDSHTEADLNDLGDWANANKKFFYGDINDITAGDGRNVLREAYMIYDKLITAGLQKISSSPTPFVGSTASGITAGTYHIDIAIDDAAADDLSIIIAGTEDWDAVAALIETALQAATSSTETYVISEGFMLCTSATTGNSSNVAITDGTGDAGGLLAIIDTLTNYLTTIESAVDGVTNWPASSHTSRKLGKEPYKTWKWKQLNGIVAVDYNLTQLNTIRTNNTNTVTEQAGVSFTNEGLTTSGDYIDTVYQIDYIESKITLAILQLFLSNESVPLDDTGIPAEESAIRGVLDEMGSLGIIAKLTKDSTELERSKSDSGQYQYKVSVPKRAEISSTDLANRNLPNVIFSYVIAGAIHTTEINGTLRID